MSPQHAAPEAAVRRARTAVAVVFATNGLAFAAFIARTPAIRDTFGLSSGQLGLLLLCLSTGAVAGLPLSGPIVHRFGAARAVQLGVLSVTTGMALLAAGLLTGVVLLAALGLVVNGPGSGVWTSRERRGSAVQQRSDAPEPGCTRGQPGTEPAPDRPPRPPRPTAAIRSVIALGCGGAVSAPPLLRNGGGGHPEPPDGLGGLAACVSRARCWSG